MALLAVATRSGAGPSDAALVVSARAGEEWAAEALFRRHGPRMNDLALRLLGRRDEVADLVQDSFVQALESLRRLEEPEAFAAWLAAIVARTAYKTLRRRQIRRRLGLGPAEQPIDTTRLIAPTAPPDVAAELSALYAVLRTLPAEVRVPLVLRRVEGSSLDEIGRMLGVSHATVKRRVADGEEALARILEDPISPPPSRRQPRSGS